MPSKAVTVPVTAFSSIPPAAPLAISKEQEKNNRRIKAYARRFGSKNNESMSVAKVNAAVSPMMNQCPAFTSDSPSFQKIKNQKNLPLHRYARTLTIMPGQV